MLDHLRFYSQSLRLSIQNRVRETTRMHGTLRKIGDMGSKFTPHIFVTSETASGGSQLVASTRFYSSVSRFRR